MDDIYAIIPVSHFKDAKTRLSPFLELKEREELLKAMLKDVNSSLKDYVDKVFLISGDREVLNYAEELGIETIVENEDSNLNKGLTQAMETLKDQTKKLIILPSDLPLIGRSNMGTLIENAKQFDFIIVPSKGGGTNALMMKPLAINMKFGEFSFLKHIKETEKNNIIPMVHDSFFMALDVNTTEDLGEIMVHGDGTATKDYLRSLKIKVESIHGAERLGVSR